MKMFNSYSIKCSQQISFVFWCGLISLKNRDGLQDFVEVCLKVAGVTLDNLTDLYGFRTLKKACAIMADPSHQFFKDYVLLISSSRYNMP